MRNVLTHLYVQNDVRRHKSSSNYRNNIDLSTNNKKLLSCSTIWMVFKNIIDITNDRYTGSCLYILKLEYEQAYFK